jgi:hypothetical protein
VEELRADLPLTNVDLEAFTEEMWVLTQKVEKANFYHHRMAKFKSLQMEHAFIKAKLLMHQSRVHKNKVELWESLKGKVVEILEETFASRRKDEKLYIL